MANTIYPTDAQITTFLVDSGLLTGSLPSSLSGIGDICSAIWEQQTGYSPFLSDQTTPEVLEVRYYDAPNDTALMLYAGLTDLDSLELDGTEQVLNSDFYTKPDNNTNKGLPITWIDFNRFIGNPKSRRNIKITGTWGYCDSLPDEVFYAICMLGAMQAYPTLTNGVVIREKQDDVEYGYKTDQTKLDVYTAEYNRILNFYTLKTL